MRFTEYQNGTEEKQDQLMDVRESATIHESRKFYIESYGCQMNLNDSEIVASILIDNHFLPTDNIEQADLILVNTCSIREKAEETVRRRLYQFRSLKDRNPGILIGILGCMAERLKQKLLEDEKIVDLVVGPDAYRDLPRLIANTGEGETGINVFLSREETYADISPVRLTGNGVTAFISIMRGCDNMCTFCVVPYTRGRERSRDPYSVIAEATDLFSKGFREITLLGQNVDSYKWKQPDSEGKVNFAQLLEKIAGIHPDMRVRFSTSHPKDITDDVLYTMTRYENICRYIHLPVQSGSNKILHLMNRNYDKAWYQGKVDRIYEIIPECAISSDIIAGFCEETEDDHLDTIEVMKYSKYSASYMFMYSERPGTPASTRLKDNVPEGIKKKRLQEIIALQNELSYRHNSLDIGKTFKVLIEGDSKRSAEHYMGRNSQNKVIVFPKLNDYSPGEYAWVRVNKATSATLIGEIHGSAQV